MNTAQAVRSGKNQIGVWTRRAAMKARTATPGSQPIVTKSASFRESTTKEPRQNIAGAPYYRGLRWDC